MDILRKIPAASEFSVSRISTVLETYLIVGDVDRERGEQVLKDLSELAKEQPDTNQGIRAKEILYMKSRIQDRWHFSIKSVANKVDLAVKLGDDY